VDDDDAVEVPAPLPEVVVVVPVPLLVPVEELVGPAVVPVGWLLEPEEVPEPDPLLRLPDPLVPLLPEYSTI